jgi:alpha-beta hydrolase superfamily lysophospholipase
MQLTSIPANPVPEGATVGTVKTSDGVVLRFARWEPPPGRKGTLCVLPGRTEFIEKYFEVVRNARARGSAQFMRLLGLGASYVPGGGGTAVNTLPFPGNKLTSDPVRYARTAAILEAEPSLAIGSPTVAWLDAAFRAMNEFADPNYASRIRQPLLLVAAGQDRVVSTPATGAFALRLRAGSHLVIPGARHELLMEQDRYREQFWAAFDAFVPGTPLF